MTESDNWPFFENPWALFLQREERDCDSTVRGRLSRIARTDTKALAAKHDKTDFLPIITKAAIAFAESGWQILTSYRHAFYTVFQEAMSYDLSSMESREKLKALDVFAQYLPPEELGIREKIKQFGHAAVTLGMILRTSDTSQGDAVLFSDASISRFIKQQTAKWLCLLLWQEWYHPALAGAKSSHRDFYSLMLGDLLQTATQTQSTEKFKPDNPLASDLQRYGFNGLSSNLKQLLYGWDISSKCRERYRDELTEEISVGIAKSLSKRRREIKSAEELFEALENGRLGLVWKDTKETLVDKMRKQDAVKRGSNVLFVELEEIVSAVKSNGAHAKVEPSAAEATDPQTYGSAFESEFESIKARLMRDYLAEACKDNVDEFLAGEIFRSWVFGQKLPTNRQLRAALDSSGNYPALSEEAIRQRRNRINLALGKFAIDWQRSRRPTA